MEIAKLLLAAIGLLFLIWKGISFLRRSLKRDKEYEEATNLTISAYKDVAESHKDVREKLKESFKEKEELYRDEIEKLKKDFSNITEEAVYYGKLAHVYNELILEAFEIIPEYCFEALSQSSQTFHETIDSISKQTKLEEKKIERALEAVVDDDAELEDPYDRIWRAARAQLPVYTLISHLKTFVDIQLYATEAFNENSEQEIDEILSEAQKRTIEQPMEEFFDLLHSFEEDIEEPNKS